MEEEKTRPLRWRIVYGYRSDEYVSIGEEYLEKAKYAWITKKVFSAPDGKMISGSEFKRIEPDFRFYTGWFDSYNPSEADDFKQIERDVPTKLIEERSLLADQRVNYILRNNKSELLQAPQEVDKILLGK